jgi:hypothetical protein
MCQQLRSFLLYKQCCYILLGAGQSVADSQSKSDDVQYANSSGGPVMIPLPPASKVKLLNAPAMSSWVDMNGTQFYGVESKHRCLECGKSMDANEHFQ